MGVKGIRLRGGKVGDEPGGLDAWIERQPWYGRLSSAGFMGEVLAKAARLAPVRPFTWWPEFVGQVATAIRRCIVPLVLSVVFFNMGTVLFLLATLIDSLGTPDRFPGALFLGQTRETAVWVSGMIFAGAAGSALCADLGARKIRDELDAMNVLGVNIYKAMVLPRILGLMVACPLLFFLGLIVGGVMTYVGARLLLVDPWIALDSIDAFIAPVEIIALTIKGMLVGLIVGVVSCAKGLSAKGGAEGVGRAVAETVVITFFMLWALNSFFNAAYLAMFPEIQTLRG